MVCSLYWRLVTFRGHLFPTSVFFAFRFISNGLFQKDLSLDGKDLPQLENTSIHFFLSFLFFFFIFSSFLFSYLIANVLESVQQLMGIFYKFWGGCLKIKKSACQEISRNTLLCNVYGNVFLFKSPFHSI